jgi:hypothetical protein
MFFPQAFLFKRQYITHSLHPACLDPEGLEAEGVDPLREEK